MYGKRLSGSRVRIGVMFLVVAASLLIFSCIACAAPSANQEIVLDQPNGDSFTARIVGDEYGNWIESSKGNILVQDHRDGYWKVARMDFGKTKVIPGDQKIGKDPVEDADASNNEVRIFLTEKRSQKKQDILAVSGTSASTTAFSAPSLALNLAVKPKILVLLVEFTDKAMVNSDSTWNQSFFGSSGSSVNAYYEEVSNGTFRFEPAFENVGTPNDGIAKVKLPYKHPNTGDTIDSRNQKIVSDALTAVNSYVNFAQFDLNGNNILETTELNIVTVVAGYERAYDTSTPSVWAHSWAISSAYKFDGKSTAKYTQQGEMQGSHMATIGVLCHELGHNIGLPDLYDYGYDSDGIGIHSLMAGGSWGRGTSVNLYAGESPTHLDAYCKTLLGFSTPVVISAPVGEYTLNSDRAAYNIFRVNTSRLGEYFLFENRQFSGFDVALSRAGVKSGGIAVWHVDENVTTRNEDELHKLVDLEEADEGILGRSELDTQTYSMYDHYYHAGTETGLVNNILFSASGTPNSNLYSGTASDVHLGILTASSNAMKVAFTEPGAIYVQKPPILAASTTAWTNTNVTVTITDPNSVSSLSYRFKSTDAWIPYTATLILQENCELYAMSANSDVSIEPATSSLVIGNIDKTLPTIPSILKATATRNSIALSWAASTDISGIKAYEVYVNGVRKTSVSGTTLNYSITGLSASRTYSIFIRAIDMAGNRADSTLLSVTTLKR